MVACSHCGRDVSGKKFCPDCGAAVPLSTRSCPACQAQVAAGSAFCTECGHNMNVASSAVNAALACPQCGRQNAPDLHFCGGCGARLNAASSPAGQYASSAANYQQSGPAYQYPQGQNPAYPPQQPSYSSNPAYPAQQAYPPVPVQPQYVQQGGYQPQPMLGQQPMVLRCPTCMAMSPIGSAFCPSCRTNLAGVVPTPAVVQGQQGGFLQGNNGKMAMGLLGGAAAVIGGEMLLNGVENRIENRVEDDMGYGERRHDHHRRDDDRGPLGGLGELADDLGLF
jgi:Predicted amidophosphoribosyltransferases